MKQDSTPTEQHSEEYWEQQVDIAFQQLLDSYLASNHRKKVDLITKAFNFARQAHKGVRRLSGEPYIMHPIAVAQIACSEIGLGSTSICCALLHDVVEDTDYAVEDIKNIFGEKIAQIVEGLTKISGGIFGEQASAQAENFKKLLLTMSEDIRVILIKICDRLHNMRTLQSQPANKQYKIAGETIYIYAPIANRLGLNRIKTELENLSFKYEHPEEYNSIVKKLERTQEQRDKEFETFTEPIRAILDKMGYEYKLKARVKSPYSIWAKMQNKHVTFDEIYDILAVRIIFHPKSKDVDGEHQECFNIYLAMGKIYKSHPDRLRDWLSHTKANGYEALHVTLMSKQGQWVEVQIRSERMDEIAENGFASHWKYKEQKDAEEEKQDGEVEDKQDGEVGEKQDGEVEEKQDSEAKEKQDSEAKEKDTDATNPNEEEPEIGDTPAGENDNELNHWLSTIKEILDDPQPDAMDFLDSIKMNLFSSEIVVFTPKGEMKKMPAGCTVLDFAFQIHTFIGSHSIGAKVNHKIVPLSHKLQSGDQVEILTSMSQHVDSTWINFVSTAKARSKIQAILRRNVREIQKKGESILTEWLTQNNMELTHVVLDRLCDLHSIQKHDALLFAIGDKTVILGDNDLAALQGKNKKASKGWKKYVPFLKSEPIKKEEETTQNGLVVIGKDFNKKKPIFISEKNINKYVFPTCCHPIPGDDALGYIDNKNHIEIHKRTCHVASKLKASFGNRILDAKWDMHRKLFFDATVRIRGIDRKGLLRDVSEVLSDKLGVNIHKITISSDRGVFDGSIEIRVHDREDVKEIIEQLKSVNDLQEVSRIV